MDEMMPISGAQIAIVEVEPYFEGRAWCSGRAYRL